MQLQHENPNQPSQLKAGQTRKPTEIWLLPQPDVSGELTLRTLPDMTLDIFSSAQLGSAGFGSLQLDCNMSGSTKMASPTPSQSVLVTS